MKKIIRVFSALSMLLLLMAANCNPEPEPTPPPTPTPDPPAVEASITFSISGTGPVTQTTDGNASAEFSADGGTASVPFSATVGWTASSSAAWCSVSPTSGAKGSATITLTIAKNETYDERTATVTLKADNATRTISVKQLAAGGMLVSPKAISAPEEGGDYEIEVQHNVEFTVTVADAAKDWISVVGTKGLMTDKVGINVKANDGASTREGTLTIKSTVGEATVTVTQAGSEKLTLDVESLEFDMNGGSGEIVVTSNMDWAASSDASWCNVSPSGGSGNGKLKVTVESYKVEGTRSAAVTVKAGDIVRTVRIEQDGVVPFSVSPASVNVGSEGGTFEIKVRSSYGYHINELPGWITEVSVSNKVHTFRVGANTAVEARTGAITFCDDESTCLSVTVRQDGHVYGPDEVDWSKEFFHRSLFIRPTNITDGFYPMMTTSLKKVQARKPGKMEVVDFYYDHDLSTLGATPAVEEFGVGSDHYGIIDGRRFIEYYQLDEMESILVNSIEKKETSLPTVTAIGWRSSISGQKFDIETYVFAKEAGDYKVSVLLVEDGMMYRQRDYESSLDYVENYRHDWVARVAVTGLTGEKFTTAGSNKMKSYKFTAEIPSDCVKDNLRIVVFVQRAYGKLSKIDGSDRDGYFIDNCASGKAGADHVPSIVSDAGGDNDDVTEGKPINW